MRELFTELRLKDYITIGLILFAVFVVINLQSIIDKKLPKVNPKDFETELLANIIQVKPLHQKSESLEGSNLKAIGYHLDIEYKIDSILIKNDMTIKYNAYKIHKSKIDQMVLAEDKILPIRIKGNNGKTIILNTLYSR